MFAIELFHQIYSIFMTKGKFFENLNISPKEVQLQIWKNTEILNENDASSIFAADLVADNLILSVS